MVGWRVLRKHVGMIFEYPRAVAIQQPLPQLACIPAQLEAQHVIGEIDSRLARDIHVDGLRHTNNFFAELLSSPVTPCDRIIGERSSCIIRINVTVSALQEEAQ